MEMFWDGLAMYVVTIGEKRKRPRVNPPPRPLLGESGMNGPDVPPGVE